MTQENETLRLSVYSPERKLLDRFEVREVTLTGSEGQIQILPGYAAMVGTLEPGGFAYSGIAPHPDRFYGFISNGFFEVQGNEVAVVAETLELAEEIDVARAESALKRANDKMKERGMSLEQYEKVQRKTARARARLQVAKSRKGH